jgi:membrane-associated protein
MDWMELLQIGLHFDRHLESVVALYGMAIYVMLFAIVFCEIAFIPLFFLPGDPLLFICGALCAAGALNMMILVPLLFAAAVAGSVVSYWTGHIIGQKLYTTDYKWLDKAALHKTHVFYEHHGGVTFLLSPFVAVVRTFAPLVGGVAEMNFAKFLLCVVTGAALWVVTLVPGGYFFGHIPVVRDHLTSIVLLGVGLGVGALVVSGTWRYFNSRNVDWKEVGK